MRASGGELPDARSATPAYNSARCARAAREAEGGAAWKTSSRASVVAAEDAVQEGYRALWRQADRLSADRGSVEGLLLTIVHRRAVEAVRVRIRQRESGDAVPDRVDLHAVDLLDAAISSMEGDRVRTALQSLSPEHREAVELAYFAQLSHREIVERIGVPLGTVKSRMHHAIRALRGSLSLGAAS